MEQIVSHPRIEVEGTSEKRLRADVAVVSTEVIRRLLFDGGFLRRRQLGLKFIRDCFCNLALYGENIIQRTMVVLCPKVGIAPGID